MIAGTDKELKLLSKTAAEFSKKELAPDREKNDKYPFGPFFDHVLKKAYDIDFFHITLPEDAGGVGQKMSALCVILESICQEDSSLGGIIFTNTASQELLISAGEKNKIEKITSEAKNVNDYLVAFPVFNNPSEIEHVAKATKKGDGYTLKGSIEYMVLGGIAGNAIVPAKTDDSDAYSFFMVDLKENGISKSDTIVSLGLHACPAIDISFDNVQAELIGSENEGELYFEKMSDRMNAPAAAMSVGIMKGSFKEALTYSKGREQGGREIINWSEIKMILANIAIKIKNSEMILSTLCRTVDNEDSNWEACAKAAAVHIQEMACQITTDGIQVLGGVGYMKDFGQEKRFRDAKHIQAFLGISPMKKINYMNRFVL